MASRSLTAVIAVAFIILIVLSSGPVSSQYQQNGEKIFFELSTGGFFGLREEGPAGFSEFKRDAYRMGFSVDDNFMSDKSLDSISGSTMNSDTIVIVNPMRELEGDEVNMLNNYVENGGNLLVICDSLDSVYYANRILESFGVLFEHEYLLDTRIDVMRNESIELEFAIPVEPGEFTVNGTANYSRDLFLDREEYNKKKPVLSAVEYGGGKVVALGSKESFMNQNYDKEKEFVNLVLHLLVSDDVSMKPKINIAPDRMEIVLIGEKASLNTITLENSENYPINVSVVVPEALEENLRPFEKKLILEGKERTQLHLLFQDEEGEYGSINTEITFQVKGKKLNVTHNYTMPVKVINI